MTQLSLKYKIAVGCVVMLLMIQYGLVPIYEWKTSALEHIQKLNRSLSRKKDLLNHVDDIQDRWQKAMKQLQETERYYQSGFADTQALQLGLQKKIEKICAEAKVNVLNMDWLPVSEGDVIQAPVKLRIEAIPHLLFKILYELENDVFFYSIDIMRITARPNSETLTVELDISAYGVKNKPVNSQ
ncbi:MAG: GspMb/PilO family protein [Deltaproteobacteria bacterium]